MKIYIEKLDYNYLDVTTKDSGDLDYVIRNTDVIYKMVKGREELTGYTSINGEASIKSATDVLMDLFNAP